VHLGITRRQRSKSCSKTPKFFLKKSFEDMLDFNILTTCASEFDLQAEARDKYTRFGSW